jgi:hypothetical protein
MDNHTQVRFSINLLQSSSLTKQNFQYSESINWNRHNSKLVHQKKCEFDWNKVHVFGRWMWRLHCDGQTGASCDQKVGNTGC